jgi:ComF family protein
MPVCAFCWQDLPPQGKLNLCTICGEQLGWGDLRFSVHAERECDSPSLCELCDRARPPFQQAIAYGVYEGTLRSLIHLLKYEQVPTVARPLGDLLAGVAAELDELPSSITVVAVPLHQAKERDRGFNQTILLGESAVRALRKLRPDVQVHDGLRALGRRRGTESQSRLTPHQRRKNLRGAFFVAEPERVSGKSILLLDDIYTTGATARECTRTLLQAGATQVYVATLARSQREGVALWDSMAAAGFAAENSATL